MPTSVIEHIRRVVGDGAGLRDGELLCRYVDRRDEAALAALINRHGPMVWGVCRRLLGHHDAEDAFQATFIVLVRKASSIAQRELVGNWLYGVAHQAALQARRTIARRREVQVTEMPDAEAPQGRRDDMQPILDQELSRLPDRYRAVIVLCDLESKTRKEVARHLGLPEGTVASRLVRARAMLAKRLTQRGVALSGGALAAVLSQQAASAGVPRSVVLSTIKAASLCGQAAITGQVAALAEGVLKAMLMSKLKAAVAVVLILGFVTAGTTIFTCRTTAGLDVKKPATEKPVEPAARSKKEKEIPSVNKSDSVEPFNIRDMGKSDLPEEAQKAFTAWGKEVGGLRAGLGIAEKRAYTHGETVTLIVRVRNVSKKAVKFQYDRWFFIQTAPAVTDGAGKPVHFRYGIADTAEVHPPTKVNLAPGKEMVLGEVKLPTAELGTGKFTVRYKRVFGKSYQGTLEIDPALKDLATGKLELEVTSKPPPAGQKAQQKQAKKKREGLTAWGKEVGRLQVGLALDAHTVWQGGKAKFTVKLRNVGNADIKVTHGLLREYAPKITATDGGKMSVYMPIPKGYKVRVTELIIKPGETMTLYNPEVAVESEAMTRLDGLIRVDTPTICVAPGKYKTAFGGMIQSHPKLATGTVEFEVKDQVAWGKEVGGPQAGLGFKPGDKRVYHHGETVTLVLRVRNVGKEVVEFKHIWAFFVENPPTITGPDGKTIPQPKSRAEGLHGPRSPGIAPGKEIDLYEWKLQLRPVKWLGNDGVPSLYGTGKFTLQCKRIVGPTSANPNNPNPVMDKLATGKLELEVKEAPK